MAHSYRIRARRASRSWCGLVASALIVATTAGGTLRGGITRPGDPDQGGGLLIEYFRLLIDDRDMDAFRDRVAARYGEADLCRVAADARTDTARRAAVIALGKLGSFPRSNPVLGRALADPDPVVRRLAQDALWSLWFRAGTPEQNQALREVIQASDGGDMDRAETLANRLIAAAPRFAEAYNQRAIIAFERGRFDDSARDCRRVLELNPYHFGALGGLAQCQLRLDRPAEAIETLKRASRLQPYDRSIPETIRLIAARIGIEDAH